MPPKQPVARRALSPQEFERSVAEYLVTQSRRSRSGWHVAHNRLLWGADGQYQIDVTAQFTSLGFRFLLLVECKHQRAPIKREQVAVLHQKVVSIGAQKGAVFSTSGFQRGALDFAQAHGIALVHCVRDESPLIVIGDADFGAEIEDVRPILAEPIEWRLFWDGQEYSAEHYIAPEIFTGRPF
jgi:hypothetical protein